ncbi:hypothetical protein [Hymenobacter glacieicola]|uniref:DUF4870 domain-containing protein n=1 Tax=Hymenobacter glacieicola TaxID=1562124 RepID=A0ABQ1WSI0_9BACT|nr:hypothetical protein [Hymenobacter glacieicola]GGG43567.1 hypothetical protein GCM10011378_19960 [Hymenobacter glacieicola]
MDDTNTIDAVVFFGILWIPQLLSFWWAVTKVRQGKTSLATGYWILYLPLIIGFVLGWWMLFALIASGLAALIVCAPTLLFTFLLPVVATPRQEVNKEWRKKWLDK